MELRWYWKWDHSIQDWDRKLIITFGFHNFRFRHTEIRRLPHLTTIDLRWIGLGLWLFHY